MALCLGYRIAFWMRRCMGMQVLYVTLHVQGCTGVLCVHMPPHLDEPQLPAQELPHAVQRPVHCVGGAGGQQQQVALAGRTWGRARAGGQG